MKLLGVLCLTGAMAVSAHASIIYDSLGNNLVGQDSEYTTGNDVNGNPARGPEFNSFMSSNNATGSVLTDLKLSLYTAAQDTGSINVGLYTNAGGNNVGALVASLGTISDSAVNLCNTDGSECTGAASVIELSGLNAAMIQSNLYWIGLTPNALNSTTILWNWTDDDTNGVGVAGGGYSNNSGTFGFGGTGNNGDFPSLMQVSATNNDPSSTTPEPASFVLLGSAMLAAGLYRRAVKR